MPIKSKPPGIRNGGFEEGLTGWTSKPAADFAKITVEEDLTAQKCRREDLARVFGSDRPSGLPLLAPKPNTAEVAPWNNEIPVSTRLPSSVRFIIRRNMADDVWQKSGRLCLELPASVRLRQESFQTSLPADGTRRTYTFDNRALLAVGNESWCSLDFTIEKPLGKDRQTRF